MNREQLEYFALAYQTHSYAAAAAQIPMSTQGLAKAIKSLEQELGVTLFTYDASGARLPTSYADALLRFTSEYDTSFQRMQEAFSALAAAESRIIRLGTALGTIGFLGPDFLDGFKREHPTITVAYEERRDDNIEKGLKLGTYDLALTILPCAYGFISTELYTSPVLFWVNRDSPLSGREELTFDDLIANRIAIPGRGFTICNLLKERCCEAGIEPLGIVDLQEIFWIYEFVLADKGLGFSLDYLSKLPVFDHPDRVVAIPVHDFSWGFGITYLPSHALSVPEQVFYNYCIDFSRDLPHTMKVPYAAEMKPDVHSV